MKRHTLLTASMFTALIAAPFSGASADEPRMLRKALYGDAESVPVDFRG